MRAFIVRHGNTFAPHEEPRRIGARTDLPLVDSGRAQAEALAAHFAARGVRFARCLCSPLLRTRQTAAIVAPDCTIEPTGWLREIDHGPDENRTEAQVIARIGAPALRAWEENAEPPPGWTVDAEARLEAWRTWLTTPPPGDTLLVTSNGAARYARLVLDLPPAKLRTGAFGEVSWEGGKAEINRWDVRPN
ncbi:histidine phosphatase family protein [Sphingomonas sp. SUN019]|uniref:histidine phosphatase family protein n=1 Tax=Sphingomonas sp. SUN019 TaxID=2937788 RepID=UPI0038D3E6D2